MSFPSKPNDCQSDSQTVEGILDAIRECVPAIGTEEFTERFLQVVSSFDAGQVTAFAYEPDRARCLLSRNFLAEDRGGTLAAAYVEGWFHRDPLFEQALALKDGHCSVARLEDLLPRIDQGYLDMFFGAPGFRTKTSVLVARGALRLVLNLYYVRDFGEWRAHAIAPVQASIYRLAGTMLASHFLRSMRSEFPLPLAVLSERERQVCIGMLAGKKAEMIADEIGIGPSSVVTYRQRAYLKLGISSRGQLFSLCRS